MISKHEFLFIDAAWMVLHKRDPQFICASRYTSNYENKYA